MTSIYAFIGPAGSGKTYALNAKLTELCSSREFQEYQSVLAITFMHGSRRRLAAKLGKRVGNGIPVLCETIDSFCLRMVNRYRKFLDREKPIGIAQGSGDWQEDDHFWRADFTTIRAAAVSLLEVEEIRQAVAAAYPVVLIDEFQDCHDDLLRIVQSLSQSSVMLVGADDFQCFHTADESPAVRWIHSSSSTIVELTGSHRTDSHALLDAAIAIRNNVAATSSIDVIPLPGSGLVAWEIFARIAWGKLNGAKSRVLIAPAGPGVSPWVKGTLGSLEKELGRKKKLGPMPFVWEDSDKDKCVEAQSLADELVGGSDQITHVKLQELGNSSNPILRLAASRACRLVSLRGAESMLKHDFRQLIELAAHSISAFKTERLSARLAMTVHGAKNREFDYAFILWPFNVPSESLQKRKLLYNAVTRARLGATLFVQGDEKRIKEDDVLSLLACGLVAPRASKKRTKSQ